MFDADTTNQIPLPEVERILCSVGFDTDVHDLLPLLNKLDKSGTGLVDYNDYMYYVIAHIRGRYRHFSHLSRVRISDYFLKLDSNGDGYLSPYEFKHLVHSACDWDGCKLTDDECDAIIELLDVDGDGCLSLLEFMRVFDILEVINHDDFDDLPHDSRSGLRKIQFSSLPNPNRLLCMFAGLPSNYRKSVLAGVAAQSEHALESLIMDSVDSVRGHTIAEIAKNPCNNENVIEFSVQIMNVTGIPTESGARRDDILNRGVRFCLCESERVSSADEIAPPPVFLGNVTKLHATVDAKYVDTWKFTNAVEMDPDASCYVKCRVEVKQNASTEELVAALDQVYLFVELVTTVKVPSSLKVGRKGNCSRLIFDHHAPVIAHALSYDRYRPRWS